MTPSDKQREQHRYLTFLFCAACSVAIVLFVARHIERSYFWLGRSHEVLITSDDRPRLFWGVEFIALAAAATLLVVGLVVVLKSPRR